MVKNNLPRIVITGSEGLIGRVLVRHFQKRYNVLQIDHSLGDLCDEKFVREWFQKNKNLSGMIVCHAHNPVPVKNTKKYEPVDTPLREVKDYLNVNTVSVFDVCRNYIKNNKKGSIITISSIYGVRSPRHGIYKNYVKPIGYSLSKGALGMMTKYLAAYYAPNFRINTVILGGVRAKGQDPIFVSRYSSHVPMKRLMKPSELTSVFDFLLDEKSSYITGAEIFVDGGWTAW